MINCKFVKVILKLVEFRHQSHDSLRFSSQIYQYYWFIIFYQIMQFRLIIVIFFYIIMVVRL